MFAARLPLLWSGAWASPPRPPTFPSYKAPPPPLPPSFTWTGLYGGVNIGYAFGDTSRETGGLGYLAGIPVVGAVSTSRLAPPGASAKICTESPAAHSSANYQFNPWLVLGAEADIQATDAVSHSNSTLGRSDAAGGHLQSMNSTKNVDWFGTVRGRVGFTLISIPNLMIYGTGGFAYGQVVNNVGFSDNFLNLGISGIGHGYYDNTKTGWTAGGGVEWSPSMFPSWSLKAEYLYVDLGSTTANSVPLNGVVPALIGPTSPVFAATHSSPTRFQVGSRGHKLALRSFRGYSVSVLQRERRSALDQGTAAGLVG